MGNQEGRQKICFVEVIIGVGCVALAPFTGGLTLGFIGGGLFLTGYLSHSDADNEDVWIDEQGLGILLTVAGGVAIHQYESKNLEGKSPSDKYEVLQSDNDRFVEKEQKYAGLAVGGGIVGSQSQKHSELEEDEDERNRRRERIIREESLGHQIMRNLPSESIQPQPKPEFNQSRKFEDKKKSQETKNSIGDLGMKRNEKKVPKSQETENSNNFGIKLVETAKKKVSKDQKSQKKCAKYVREILEEATVVKSHSLKPPNSNSAKDYGAGIQKLDKKGYNVYDVTSEKEYQKGDVIIFDSVPGHPHGHIEIYVGEPDCMSISDYRQKEVVFSFYKNSKRTVLRIRKKKEESKREDYFFFPQH